MQTIQFKVDNTELDFFKQLLDNFTSKIKDFSIFKDNSEVKTVANHSRFKSKEDEYIFYLLDLDGEIQSKKLNIKPILYKDKIKAKKWRNNITKIINPNISKDRQAMEATKKLNNIYENMMKYAK